MSMTSSCRSSADSPAPNQSPCVVRRLTANAVIRAESRRAGPEMSRPMRWEGRAQAPKSTRSLTQLKRKSPSRQGPQGRKQRRTALVPKLQALQNKGLCPLGSAAAAPTRSQLDSSTSPSETSSSGMPNSFMASSRSASSNSSGGTPVCSSIDCAFLADIFLVPIATIPPTRMTRLRRCLLLRRRRPPRPAGPGPLLRPTIGHPPMRPVLGREASGGIGPGRADRTHAPSYAARRLGRTRYIPFSPPIQRS